MQPASDKPKVFVVQAIPERHEPDTASENERLREENERLREELKRLKGDT